MTTQAKPSEAMKRRIEAMSRGQLPPPAKEQTIKPPRRRP